MDESFFRSETPTTHTWGDRKDRKQVKVSGQKHTIAVIGAVDSKNGDHEEWIFDSVNSDVVNSFLWKLSEKYPIPKNIHLLFQPPYSPELNSQENVWKIVKDHFKNLLCRTIEELQETVCSVFQLFANYLFKFGEI